MKFRRYLKRASNLDTPSLQPDGTLKRRLDITPGRTITEVEKSVSMNEHCESTDN